MPTEDKLTRRLMVSAVLSVQILLTTLVFAALHRADALWLIPALWLVVALIWMRRASAKVALIGACALTGLYGYWVGNPMPGGHGLREPDCVFVALPVIFLLSFALGAAEREFASGLARIEGS